MIKIGNSVKLNISEQRLAEYVAQRRCEWNDRLGVPNVVISSLGQRGVDLEGIAGELAFCRLFNVYPDLETDVEPPYKAYDCVLYDRLRVDVKNTTYEHGRLLVSHKTGEKAGEVDAYALMTGTFPGPYVYRGMMNRHELIQEKRIGEIYGNRSYMAWQNELVDMVFLY